VRANIAAAYTSHTKLDATATVDLVLDPAVDENRTPWWDDKCDNTYCNDEVRLFGGWVLLHGFKLAPFTPKIVVDDAARVAWFTADLEFSGTLAAGDTLSVKGKWPVRAIGIVVDDHGWKVAAEKFSLVATDAKLVANHDYIANYGSITGATEKSFAAWFPKKLAAHRSARAIGVTGTSPRDVGRTKPAMAKLVASWDKLALSTKAVELKVLAGGKIAWAKTTVVLPVKGGSKLLTVGIVAVPESGGWKWVLLNWSPELQPDEAVH